MGLRLHMSAEIRVMVNGMPGPMALETAKACVDRGYTLVPFGFTGGSGRVSDILVQGKARSVKVDLVKGPSFGLQAEALLRTLKAQHPGLIVVDYTHPSATLSNLQAYVDCNCDFVMGTTGGDYDQMRALFAKSPSALAVIAPNMAKQIVALQAALLEMAKRFPASFLGYKLTVTESHQKTKADTSGTAKVHNFSQQHVVTRASSSSQAMTPHPHPPPQTIVTQLATLTGDKTFTLDDIVKIREEQAQQWFGVPQEFLEGHAYHTYHLTSPDGSVNFELQHNVSDR